MKLIALGSNLISSYGDPAENIRAAARLLRARGFEILAHGDLYESAPVPVSDQPNFINTVISVAFSGTAEEALAACLDTECEMGRIRGERNEARIIDIDVIAWEGLVQEGEPTLPHPRMHARAFVLYPLCDFAPEWQHPVLRRNAAEMKMDLPPCDIREAGERW